MKYSKWIITMFLFFIVMLFSSELYQQHLYDFSNSYFYFQVAKEFNDENIVNLVEETAERYDTDVFCVKRETESQYLHILTIYATEGAKEQLQQRDISDGSKKSLFSGSTQVIFKDYEEVSQLMTEDMTYYLTGDKEQAQGIKDEVNNVVATSYIHKEDSTGLEWVIRCVWILTIVFVLFLTVFDIRFQKKENFVAISLGMSPARIMVKNVVQDTVVFCCIFSILHTILSTFISLEYERNEHIILLVILLIVNGLLYFSIFSFDYKKVMYQANLNEHSLGDCYVLKLITMIITLAVVSVNVGLIVENQHYVNMYETIDEYAEYSFVELVLPENEDDDEQEVKYQEVYTQLLRTCLRNHKVALAQSYYENADGKKGFYVNENTKGLEHFKEFAQVQEDKKYCVFIPKELANEKGLAEEAFQMAKLNEEEVYQVIYYSTDINLVHFAGTEELDMGFENEKNPIMVYCNLDKIIKSDTLNKDACHTIAQNAMYSISEKEKSKFISKWNLEDVKIENVVEKCNYYENSLKRIVLLNTVISGFMLLLEFLILTTIIRMEYSINAKKLAIKKMLGYSVLRKNGALFALNIYASVIGIATMVTCSIMFDIPKIKYILPCWIVLYIVEFAYMVYYIRRIEKTSIIKTLKGGSL